MEQRLFLLPAGEGQDEGERDDIPDLATSKMDFEAPPRFQGLHGRVWGLC